MKLRAGILAVLLPLSLWGQKEGERLFALKINSLLESKCIVCHSAKEGKTKGDLDLSTREDMLLGGETSDKVLVPGHPEKSLIMTAIEWKDEDSSAAQIYLQLFCRCSAHKVNSARYQ